MKKKIGVFIPATLGMLTAFGPFVTDFYLPVLPEMSEFFHTSPALASLSLTTGMIGLAIGQVFIGPLTDKFGRKKILVGSMLMFAIASVLCILVTQHLYLQSDATLPGIGRCRRHCYLKEYEHRYV